MATSSDIIFYRYSPENMSEDILRKLFVGREKLLESMVTEIENAAKNKTPRFYLMVGPRGIGKSHFLTLLYYEINNKFPSLLIPVKLAEEEYSVYRASDLFLRILEEYSEDTSDILSLKEEDEILHAAVEKLKQISKQDGKRFIIFVENLHELFKQLEKEELHKLRSIFQKYDIFSVVATAPLIFPSLSGHDEPFYDFFNIQHLNEFSYHEIRELMQKIAETENGKDFFEKFGQYEERIHGMVHLTGGSPRLVFLFYDMITGGEIENIENAFFKIIDEHTPFYQEIFQMLTGQQRRIFDVLISFGETATPKQISEKARIKIQTVNTQLRRLETDGYVISRPMGRHTKYEVRERLFRLWREMRQPFGRKRVSILIDFLQLWYTAEERKELFEIKFKLLEAGEKSVLKELCYYAEIQPIEFKVEALLKLTPKLMEMGKLEDANYEISKLRETAAQTKDNKLDSTISLYEGILLIFNNKLEDAIEAFNKVLETDPKYEDAFLLKIITLILLKKYEKALKAINRVLEINPKDEDALLFKSLILDYMKNHEKALEAINRVLEINPEHEGALFIRGLTLELLGKHHEALECLNIVLKINPEDEDALFNKGLTLNSLEMHQEALKAFNMVLEINPEYEAALLCKGLELMILGKYEEAVEGFNIVLEINPNQGEALKLQSVALLKLKRYEETLDVLTKKSLVDTTGLEKIETKFITIGTYIGLNKKAEAVFEIEKIYNKIADQEPKFIQVFMQICLIIALGELKDGNRGNADKFIKMAFENSSKLEMNMVKEFTMTFLKGAANSGELHVIKAAAKEILNQQIDEFTGLLRFLLKGIEIIETKDLNKYYDLQIEDREIVADVVKKITKSDELVPDEIKKKDSY